MTALVSVETVLLVLLVVLVAGLLRSHAEILRRLGPASDAQADAGAAVPEPPARARRVAELRAAPLVGTTPDGDPLTLSFDGTASRADPARVPHERMQHVRRVLGHAG